MKKILRFPVTKPVTREPRPDRLESALAQLAAAVATLATNQKPPQPTPRASVPLVEAVSDFLRAKARAGRSDRYLRQLRVSLSAFVKGHELSPISALTVTDIETWLDTSGWKAKTRRGYLGDVSTLFNFARRRGWCQDNPAAAVELPTLPQTPPAIHTPAQVRAVMDFARRYDIHLCRCLAVRYFAGLRSSEAQTLREENIRDGYIEVTAARSKTRRRRLVSIQPNLAAWLAAGGTLPLSGNASNTWRYFTAALLRKLNIDWPHNVTRHSFVSYHLAQFQHAGKTALEAGHTEAVLFSNYRETVTAQAAAAFWSIAP